MSNYLLMKMESLAIDLFYYVLNFVLFDVSTLHLVILIYCHYN